MSELVAHREKPITPEDFLNTMACTFVTALRLVEARHPGAEVETRAWAADLVCQLIYEDESRN